jgi:hypothetical protein
MQNASASLADVHRTLTEYANGSPAEIATFRYLHASLREFARALIELPSPSPPVALDEIITEPLFDLAACPIDVILAHSANNADTSLAVNEHLREAVSAGLCHVERVDQLATLLPSLAAWISDVSDVHLVRGALRILYDACHSLLSLDQATAQLFGDLHLRRHWRSIAATCQEMYENYADRLEVEASVLHTITQHIQSRCH